MSNTQTRAEEVSQERRRRRGDTVMMGTKLGVNPDFLDPAYNYRWINDDGIRIEQLTVHDDWDLVDDPNKVGKQDTDGLGTKMVKAVNKGGGRAYLARKLKKFYNEDQAAKGKVLDATMDSIKRGIPQAAEGAAPLSQSHAYVPNGPSGIDIR